MAVTQLTGGVEQEDTMKEGIARIPEQDEENVAVRGNRTRARGCEALSAGSRKTMRKHGQTQTTLTTYLATAGSLSPRVKSPFFPGRSSLPPSPIPASLHALIATHPSLPAFRRLVLRTLCQVPRSRTTTYAALAGFLRSHPRAIGNAMRHNPFAPRVPCHRVVASGGGIGGFAGEWGDGDRVAEKVRLLRGEGVVVEEVAVGGENGKGKKAKWRVRGEVWDGFVPVGHVAVGESVVSV